MKQGRKNVRFSTDNWPGHISNSETVRDKSNHQQKVACAFFRLDENR